MSAEDLSAEEAELDDTEDDAGVQAIEFRLEASGERLDKVVAALLPAFSRARLQALIAEGALTRDGLPLTSSSAKVQTGVYRLLVPALIEADPQPQDLHLEVLFEDAHLIIINKPAGMAAHPGPGTPDGTLVNALLHHCAGSLSGIGGVARPGIVHRLDKDTSGVMVAAKTDAAHAGLSALFARHDIERRYIALVRSAPNPSHGVIQTQLGRSPHDRKKMAVLKSGGREAITHYRVEQVFGPAAKPVAARAACELETGRTHQIRVHLASKGAPCLGDVVYGSGAPAAPVKAAIEEAGLHRQALHAAVLGFVHPITGERLRFETPLPPDMATLEALLSALQ